MPPPYTPADRAESDARKCRTLTGQRPGQAKFIGLDVAAMGRGAAFDRGAAEAKRCAEIVAAEEARLLEEEKAEAFIHKIADCLKALITFPKPKERKAKGTKTFSFSAHCKQALEVVMPVLSNAPDPQGNRWTKATPYFSSLDLLKALHRLEVLDSLDINFEDPKQVESRSKLLKKAAKELGYLFLDGRGDGSDDERESIRCHLVKTIEHNTDEEERALLRWA